MKVIHLPSGGNFYQTPSGLFPSVTTILKATMPEEQRKRLRNWHQRNGSDVTVVGKEWMDNFGVVRSYAVEPQMLCQPAMFISLCTGDVRCVYRYPSCF
jgi:hypothetical protein